MLIDNLLHFYSQHSYEPFSDWIATYQRLQEAMIFQVDNVASYAYEHLLKIDETRQASHDTLSTMIPNAAPLAPCMWFEFGGLAKHADRPATNRYGVLISIEYDRRNNLDLLIPMIEEQSPGERAEKHVPDNVQWILRCQGFAYTATGLVFMRLTPYISVTQDGTPAMYAVAFAGKSDPTKPSQAIYNEMLVALLATCFAHCQGTEIEEHQPTRQIRRAREREGRPAFSFHTIDIKPSKTILRTEGHITENGLAKSLHICRGHFAHYTADKPLFGKYTGTFYRPMHIRGNAEQGIVAKDYHIHPELST